MTPKALVISTLRTLTRSCLKEQINLRLIRAARRQIVNDERAALQRIKTIKRRIDRELVVSGGLLGMPKLDDDS